MSTSSTPSKATGTLSKSKGVGFLHHYPKNFFRLYGAADEAPSSDTIFRRTTPMTCEMLMHPTIHFSEVAETIADKIAIINESPLISKKAHANLMDVKQLGDMHSKFSLKDVDQPPSKDDAKTMMRAFIEESSVEQFMRSAFTVGSALFSIASSYLVTQAYLRDPTVLADKLCMALEQDATFKASHKLTAYRDIILAGHKCAHGSQASETSGTAIQNLLLQLSAKNSQGSLKET